MTSILSIRVRNLDVVSQSISLLPIRARGIATKEAGVYLIGNAQRGLRHYAKPRPRQKYKRTYKLRGGWRISGDTGVKARVENNVAYARYVQGDEDQAWMHVGRWRTTTEVWQDNLGGMLRRIDQVLEAWIKANGL